MPNVQFKYGKEILTANFREDNLMAVLEGSFPPSPTKEEEEAEVLRSIRNPIGSPPLSAIAKKGQRVVIMASDITRPSPSYKILPPLVAELNACGVPDEDITVMFGMGIHRPHTREEHITLVGREIYDRITCRDSTEGSYVLVGTSSQGTPYHVNKEVAQSDLLICTGNIEYHWFAGYSGGAKAVLPGACNYETIRHNHSMISRDGTGSGLIEGNPLRRDIDEIARFLDIRFIVNVVLNDKKQILKAFSGHFIDAHREGCEYLDSVYSKRIPEKADVVVVSCGGYPKDINIYQAQKALDNANLAVKDGGVVVMVASCKEGYGEDTFERWVNDAHSPGEILERINREFELGGHKAAGFAKVLTRAQVILVTDMEKEKVTRMFIDHYPKEALQEVIDKVTKNASSVLVIPQGGSILPKVSREV